MKQINPKDKSMIARMAGNIVGPMLAHMLEDSAKSGSEAPDGFIEVQATMAVGMAMAIIDVIEQHIPCGECEECQSDIRCREVPAGEGKEHTL
jgi:hypothetical protein